MNEPQIFKDPKISKETQTRNKPQNIKDRQLKKKKKKKPYYK